MFTFTLNLFSSGSNQFVDKPNFLVLFSVLAGSTLKQKLKLNIP